MERQEQMQQHLGTLCSHNTLQHQACGSDTEKSVCGTALVLVHPPNASPASFCDASAFPLTALEDFAAPGFTKGLAEM